MHHAACLLMAKPQLGMEHYHTFSVRRYCTSLRNVDLAFSTAVHYRYVALPSSTAFSGTASALGDPRPTPPDRAQPARSRPERLTSQCGQVQDFQATKNPRHRTRSHEIPASKLFHNFKASYSMQKCMHIRAPELRPNRLDRTKAYFKILRSTRAAPCGNFTDVDEISEPRGQKTPGDVPSLLDTPAPPARCSAARCASVVAGPGVCGQLDASPKWKNS